ncbi:hypothetical protein [Rhodalgimonas zhirmunskyi]|uniref:DUF998 domain-containing protein n=1 Tax=Rhodalgimonas zhirmunskyi TaxID=2964767 RepID=A0AAJ1X5K6_9RHOB|nr:hypothetical protein [Rhodoalgimonas zhirmunskyi]MDQ2094249.1 hypothetical protein [Rhodoalgimonas zhirmunskyi]
MTDYTRNDYVLSFYRVRQALGFLGLAFPILLFIGGELAESKLHPSISDYYHSTLRDVYVGTLFAIGVFLVSYRGHPRQSGDVLSDNLAATLGGIGAFGLALFPNRLALGMPPNVSQLALGEGYAQIGHFTSALLFLGAMAWLCLGRFARTSKPARRRIYRFAGFTIVFFGLAATVASVLRATGSEEVQQWILSTGFIFWCEALGIWAFGLAWLTKGRADISLINGASRLSGRALRDPAPKG